MVACPSRGEGFGLPVMEAMACGAPVVAFDNSALPEVVGDAGVLVSDGDVEAMVNAVRGLASSCTQWDELRAAGLTQAANFRWAQMDAAYCQLFESVSR